MLDQNIFFGGCKTSQDYVLIVLLNFAQHSQLLINIDGNGFSLGIVKSVLGGDGGKHGESKQQDEDEGQGSYQSHPDHLRKERDAVPAVRELVVHHIKRLQLQGEKISNKFNIKT